MGKIGHWIATAFAFLAIPAQACPLCHSSTAEEVRAGILATALDGNVIFAVAGPFLILGIVLSFLNRAPENREEDQPWHKV